MSQKNNYGFLLRAGESLYKIPQTSTPYSSGTILIVETTRGTECGLVMLTGDLESHKKRNDISIKKVVRLASETDKDDYFNLNLKEIEYMQIGRQICVDLGSLFMIRTCEVLFDHKKAIFHYQTDDDSKNNMNFAVKLKQLQTDLSNKLKCQIELLEVNPRGLSKVVGGIGTCGRSLCCSSFLNRPKAISVKMAKTQHLAINMAKLTGQCGKLKCCLRYELENYQKDDAKSMK